MTRGWLFLALTVSSDGESWPEDVTQLVLYDLGGLSGDPDLGPDGELPYVDEYADLGAIVKPDGTIMLYTNFYGSIGVYEPI